MFSELTSSSSRGSDDDLVLLVRFWEPRVDRAPLEEGEEGVAFDENAARVALGHECCHRRLSGSRRACDHEQRHKQILAHRAKPRDRTGASSRSAAYGTQRGEHLPRSTVAVVTAACAGNLVRVETDRLMLRRWRDADRGPFAALNADPVVMEYFPAVQTADETNAFVDRIERHFEDHGWGFWAVEIPGTAPFIGFVGLSTLTVFHVPVVEIGWRLDKRYWNNGYATEAAQASLRYGFETLDLDQIVAITAHDNWSSRRVMEKLSMTHDPTEDFEHPNVPSGHRLQPFVLYRIRNPEHLRS